MKAMALAAGKGTRLFPLTGEIPKPMAPVVNTPIIEHIFGLLADHGVEEVRVNVYYLADALLEAYGEESTVNGMTVHLEREDELLGTAGGVKRLADRFDDTFVVVSGDALTDVNITELVEYHKKKGALANTGIYIFEPRALDYIPEDTFFDFAEDVFPKLLENGEQFVGYQKDFYWSDIGTLEAYRQA